MRLYWILQFHVGPPDRKVRKERPEPLDRKAQPDRQVHKESRESKDQKEKQEPPDRRVRKEQPGQQLVLKWELLRPGKREVRHPSQMQVQQVLPY